MAAVLRYTDLSLLTDESALAVRDIEAPARYIVDEGVFRQISGDEGVFARV